PRAPGFPRRAAESHTSPAKSIESITPSKPPPPKEPTPPPPPAKHIAAATASKVVSTTPAEHDVRGIRANEGIGRTRQDKFLDARIGISRCVAGVQRRIGQIDGYTGRILG